MAGLINAVPGTSTVQTKALPTATTAVNTVQAAPTTMPNAQQVAPAQVTINQPTDTVQGQINGVIDKNGPLQQLESSRAMQQANARGLMGTNLAVESAQNAVLNSALPIATTDAGAYRATKLANADMTNQGQQFNAQQANAMATADAQITADTNKFNALQQNQAIFNQLDAANRIQLADIQATYQNEMQANSSASQLFNQTMAAINNIQQSTTMDAATKKASTDQVVSLLKSGLALQGSIANLNLGNVLNFSV